MLKPNIVCVMGPTSSGKTALGLALAKACHGEVVNADARQLYRDAPIGTGVPEGRWEERDGKSVYVVDGVPHHLMAVSVPHDAWTVSRWCEAAKVCVDDVLSRQRVPIIVGGTGLYIRAFTEGFVFTGEPKPGLRDELLPLDLNERVRRLLEHDPAAREKIDLQNPHRVLRALERVMAGQPLIPEKQSPPYAFCKIGIDRSTDELKQQIRATVHRQFENGWVEEIQGLLENGVSEASPLMMSIGFRIIAHALHEKRSDREMLETAVAHDTWRYARRQRTWFRKEPQIQWIREQGEAMQLVQSFLV